MENSAADVEEYIMNQYTEPGMSKVVSVRATPAVPPGQNFLSSIWRLSMTVLLKDGNLKERNLIFKKLPEEEETRMATISSKAFQTEILMYDNVLKKMDEIMKEIGNLEERPWCGGFIPQDNPETLLLQDLKPLGYESAGNSEVLTLEEACLVFKTLARFHAASTMLVDRGDIQLSLFSPRRTTYDTLSIERFIVKAVHNMAKGIEESWGSEWKELAIKLNQSSEILVNKTKEVGIIDETKFNVVVHGDLWASNILFQRDTSGIPIRVKFVDLQLSFYHSPCFDLTYLAFTSLTRSLRKSHLDELLRLYTDTLNEDLRRYGYPGEKIPSYEYFLEEMKRFRFWALITIVLYNAMILTGRTGNKEDAKKIMDPRYTSGVPEIYKSQLFKETAAEDLMDFVREGVLD